MSESKKKTLVGKEEIHISKSHCSRMGLSSSSCTRTGTGSVEGQRTQVLEFPLESEVYKLKPAYRHGPLINLHHQHPHLGFIAASLCTARLGFGCRATAQLGHASNNRGRCLRCGIARWLRQPLASMAAIAMTTTSPTTRALR